MSQSKGLRILIMTPSLPYPPNWGFGIRVFKLIQHLAKQHEVSLLTYATEDADSKEKIAVLEKVCTNVHTILPTHTGGLSKRKAQFVSLFSPISFQTRSLRSPAMQQRLHALQAQEPFDIIQTESSQMCGFDFGNHSLVLLDEHNLEYELLYRMYLSERSPGRRLYNWLEYVKFRKEEQNCWKRADGCILTSSREEEILRKEEPGKPTRTVPNGVDIEYFSPMEGMPDPESIVFTGLISYRPNTDAVLYFVQDILPLIRQKRPNVVFTIVGMGPPEEIKRLAGPNVVVTDAVPDVRPYVAKASVVVVPLRMGSGTRLKVLEGLSMGKPMVSTSLGSEGITVRDGEHLLLADTPETIAKSVLCLMENRELATKLGKKGRKLAEQEYSWTSVGQTLEGFYAERLAAHPRSRSG